MKKSIKKTKSKSKFLGLNAVSNRVRLCIAVVLFAIAGSTYIIYSQAQQASMAQCTIACRGIAAASSGSNQYWEVGADGGVFSFGGAKFHGSLPGKGINVSNVVGIAANPAKTGYWIATKTGDVHNFGAAPAPAKPHISSYGASVNNIVAIAAAPSGAGYYLVGSDGGVYAFDAPFHGSMGGQPLNQPMVGMAVRSQGGYWLVGADGGVFSYGGAPFLGALSGTRLSKPIVAIEATPSGNGYWLVGADGGVFNYGDAKLHGSLASTVLNAPINSISRTASGNGYWLSASDGGVFAYGDAQYAGNATVPLPPKPVAAPVTTTQPAPTSTPTKQQLIQNATAPIVCKSNELALKDSTGKIVRCVDNGVTPNPVLTAPVGPPRPNNPAPSPGTVTAPPRPTTCIGTPTLRRGSSGPCVVEIQKLLGITQDGKFGANTETAVKNFQRSKGLAADGVVGPKTWAALRGNTSPVVVNPPPPTGDINSGVSSPDKGTSVKMIPSTGNYTSSTTGCHNISDVNKWQGLNDRGAVDSLQGFECRFVYEQYGTVFRDGRKPVDCSIYINLERRYSSSQNWSWPGFRRRKNVGCEYRVNNNAGYNSALFSGTLCAPDADMRKCYN